MARNVEIKAVCRDRAALRLRIETLAGTPVVELRQDDSFFVCATGRLKLRDFGNGRAELIAYERPDTPEPSLSSYTRSETDDPAGIRATLSRALGCWTRVIKTRQLYMVERTRIHLDQVEGLGDFVELEVVLDAHEQPADGRREAERLMAELGIDARDLCVSAYADMLADND
ncbi:class IV adenylate cyclase [Salinisphaera sp.]|uniref:class IV adenylate cyclase n=1 Tax=Salinisphaera sp. TaxID=1914330 RepID=UPI002D7898FC|nr:class IV adenylate cyclase [Salinisphaera sp.]HET7315026.1 class IV adenylate cyclase [Salinisphaera sp.]